MVKAALPLAVTRESLTYADRQLVLNPIHNDIQVEELKRTYSIQNSLLARKNEELQLRVTNLENQLFQTQKQVLTLRNEKIQLNEKMKLNSKHFNDVIVSSLDKLMSEYRTFMADVGVEVSNKHIPAHLSQKIDNEGQYKATDFEHYWQNINDDLRRRKSSLFSFRGNSSDSAENIDTKAVIPISEGALEEDQLDTLVEKEEEAPLEPEYKEENSTNIPVKRQPMIMEKIDSHQLTHIPFLGVSKSTEEGAHKPLLIEEDHDSGNDELFNQPIVSPPDSPSKADQPARLSLGTDGEAGVLSCDEEKEGEVPGVEKSAVQKVAKTRRGKIPRELRNLDTEKTKKWLGMDPLDDVGESTSERRKSRRRSLVVNYQLPSLKQKMRRSSGRFSNVVYTDEDQENRVKKPKSSKNRNALRNITNISQAVSRDSPEKSDRERSIFDLENADIFGEYKSGTLKNRGRSRDEVYDMLL